MGHNKASWLSRLESELNMKSIRFSNEHEGKRKAAQVS